METILVAFGGRSVEHEVSIITGMQVMENMDKKYNAVPLYVTKEGKFLSGDVLKSMKTFKSGDFSGAYEVFLKPGDNRLYREAESKGGLFSKGGTTLEAFLTIDCVFPALHGTYGEDGCFQGYLETAGVPYVGCGVMSAAVGMDKVVMKKVFESEGIPMTPYLYFYRGDDEEAVMDRAEAMGYNLFVKPANLGSSIGISKVKNREELKEAIAVASHYDRKILIEKAVESPREINAAVLGYEHDLLVTELEEPVGWKEFLKYDEKYMAGGKSAKSSGSKGMAASNRNLPAQVSDDIKEQIQGYAKKAFRAIDGMGVARIDFLLDGETVYVNEINTLPGSVSFYLLEATGVSFKDEINKLIDLAKVRYQQRHDNITSYDTDLLTKTTYGAKL
ncbi:D-alanine--D-alanine ligase [Peptoniphilus equinus]|uniref:D-alanine--D-alanine ligase n=1 Tax=Peptoniphilus equinus TaxID=3016343 RepID=A0ABY7QS43_9FIRM|nr:D-alanine--D-alanine ligase family protein [Peptoniphilus equinus]WBW49609.1 D-alanine--D-alanine ligase [Peptoniphilus equinus]